MTPVERLLALHTNPVLTAVNVGRLARSDIEVGVARQWCIEHIDVNLAAQLLEYAALVSERLVKALSGGSQWDTHVVLGRDNLESVAWALGLATVDAEVSEDLRLIRLGVTATIELVETLLEGRRVKGSEWLLKTHPHFKTLTRKDHWWIPAKAQAN